MNDVISEATARRRAARRGLRLWKVRENSRWFHQYGPYALVDASTTALVAHGLSRSEVAEAIAGR